MVGDGPPHGPGAGSGFAIYGNFFHGNPGEALFQGEGRIALYANVLVGGAAAVRIRPHNGLVRDVLVFRNTIVGAVDAVVVTGGAPGFVQRVVANAVYGSGTPLVVNGADASELHNVVGGHDDAAAAFVAPTAPLGRLDLHPRAGSGLRDVAVEIEGIAALPDAARDFDGRPYDSAYRGAYAGLGGTGWRLALAIKP